MSYHAYLLPIPVQGSDHSHPPQGRMPCWPGAQACLPCYSLPPTTSDGGGIPSLDLPLYIAGTVAAFSCREVADDDDDSD